MILIAKIFKSDHCYIRRILILFGSDLLLVSTLLVCQMAFYPFILQLLMVLYTLGPSSFNQAKKSW